MTIIIYITNTERSLAASRWEDEKIENAAKAYSGMEENVAFAAVYRRVDPQPRNLQLKFNSGHHHQDSISGWNWKYL